MTYDRFLFSLTLVAALGSGLIAGVFFAFSAFVMRALSGLPAPHGIAAMQSINVVVINSAFLGTFLGTALASAVAMALALLRWAEPGSGYLLAGAAFYLVGTFGVTMVVNVPLNNALAAVSPDDAEGAGVWSRYVTRWTAWNHVRTAAALAAAGLFTVALRG